MSPMVPPSPRLFSLVPLDMSAVAAQDRIFLHGWFFTVGICEIKWGDRGFHAIRRPAHLSLIRASSAACPIERNPCPLIWL